MPIGDFIAQTMYTFTFSSIIQSVSLILFSCPTGYRHVYLEGVEEASIFVHVAINDITGKVTFNSISLLHKCSCCRKLFCLLLIAIFLIYS